MFKILINTAACFVISTSVIASHIEPQVFKDVGEDGVKASTTSTRGQRVGPIDYLKDAGVLELFDQEQRTGSLFIHLQLISTSDCEDLTRCLKESGIWDRCKQDKAGEGLYKLYAMLFHGREFNKDKASKVGEWIKELPIMKTANFVALRDLFILCMEEDFPNILAPEKISSMYVSQAWGVEWPYKGYNPNEPWFVLYTALLDINHPNATVGVIVRELVTHGRLMDRIKILHRIFQFHGVDSPLALSFLDKLGVRDYDRSNLEEFYNKLSAKILDIPYREDERKHIIVTTVM